MSVSSPWYPGWVHDNHMWKGEIHGHIQKRYQDTRGEESWWGGYGSEHPQFIQ